jgi:outer membrane protein TolC
MSALRRHGRNLRRGAGLVWELDLFGGKRRAFEAATAQLARAKRIFAMCS